jgi:tRNA-specific 2-thiouridylase
VPGFALRKSLFPIGHLHKREVREIARQRNLPTSEKKDSTGICFIGKRNFREFLGNYIAKDPGDFETIEGRVMGQHLGLSFYTIGQRKGLGIGGPGEAWYVVDKDVARNVVVIAQGENHPALFQSSLVSSDLSWITPPASFPFRCTAKVRYRQQDTPCVIERVENGQAYVFFDRPQGAVTPGQYVVFYDNEVCLGGGRISLLPR